VILVAQMKRDQEEVLLPPEHISCGGGAASPKTVPVVGRI
jgi:hypothetical protein